MNGGDGMRPVILVVSDGTGETCSQVLRAALVQFQGRDIELVVRPDVQTPARVRGVVDEAARRGASILYTLVVEDARRAMRRMASARNVPTVDVLGPLMTALHDVFMQAPTAEPGLFAEAERGRIARQAAVEYTLKHDDGQRPFELDQADVVLVGPSRASKSTTCFYLAYNGIKAANVPLLPGRPPLPQLLTLDTKKVIGLRMNVTRLMAVRQVRARHLGDAVTDSYIDRAAVAHEVLDVQERMRRHGWRTIDVSYLAVEEIAREVLHMRGLRAERGLDE